MRRHALPRRPGYRRGSELWPRDCALFHLLFSPCRTARVGGLSLRAATLLMGVRRRRIARPPPIGEVGAPSDGGHSQGGVFVGPAWASHPSCVAAMSISSPASSSSITPLRAYITKPTTLRLRPLPKADLVTSYGLLDRDPSTGLPPQAGHCGQFGFWSSIRSDPLASSAPIPGT